MASDLFLDHSRLIALLSSTKINFNVEHQSLERQGNLSATKNLYKPQQTDYYDLFLLQQLQLILLVDSCRKYFDLLYIIIQLQPAINLPVWHIGDESGIQQLKNSEQRQKTNHTASIDRNSRQKSQGVDIWVLCFSSIAQTKAKLQNANLHLKTMDLFLCVCDSKSHQIEKDMYRLCPHSDCLRLKTKKKLKWKAQTNGERLDSIVASWCLS